MKHPTSFHRKYLATVYQGDDVMLRFITREQKPALYLARADGVRVEVLDLDEALCKIEPDHFMAFLSGRKGWMQEQRGQVWMFHHDGLEQPLQFNPDRDRKAWGKEWSTHVWRFICQLAEIESLNEVQVLSLLVEPFGVLTPVPTGEVRKHVIQCQFRKHLLRQLPTFDVLRVFCQAFWNVREDDFYRVLRKYGFTDDYIKGCWIPFLDNPLGYMFTRSPDTQGRVLLAEIIRHVDLVKLEKAVSVPAKEEADG